MNKELLYKEIFILGKKWKIREISNKSKMFKKLLEDTGEKNIFGTYDEDKKIIFIIKEAEYLDKLTTLLHEIIHILVDCYTRFDICKEDKTKQLAENLFDILSTNRIKLW